MSQPQSSADTNVLLQSMLQRLRIQQERGTQAFSAIPAGAASSTGLEGETDTTRFQNVGGSPVNGFGFYNGSTPKDVGTFGVGENLLSSNLKYSTDHSASDRDGFGKGIKPGMSPASTAGSLKESGGTLWDGATPVKTSDAGQSQDQVFTPKVFSWSLNSTDERNGTGGPEDVAPVRTDGSEGLVHDKDSYPLFTNQNSTSSPVRRNQRPMGNRARKWTQKLKERWRDRPGSFGKKAKEEELQTEQRTTILPQNHVLPAVGSSNQDNLASPVISNLCSPPLTQRETSTLEDSLRSSGDFDFGLGSFSLLEEIGMGQEWAKFLNPSQSAASTNKTTSNEHQVPATLGHDSQQTANHVGSVSNSLVFSSTGATQQLSDVNMTRAFSNHLQPVSMDVCEGKQLRVADQAEPGAFSPGDPQAQLVDRRTHHRPQTSFAQPADVQRSSMKGRKRQHRSIEVTGQQLQTQEARKTDGGFTSALTTTGSHMMEATATPEPLHTINSPTLSPASFNPFAPRKGVLKHSISQDSESSTECLTKRRRVEENKRVHFSEKVLAIAPPELDTDSEEESIEEDSMNSASSFRDQEDAEVKAEGVASPRRPTFPAWILFLKRRNTDRKK